MNRPTKLATSEGHPEESELIARIIATETDEVAPPPQSVRSLTKPGIHPIDSFIRDRLKMAKIQPRPESDRATLGRR